MKASIVTTILVTTDKGFKVNARVLESTQTGVFGTTDSRRIIAVVSMAGNGSECKPPFSLHPYHVSEELGFVLSDPLVS